MGRLMLCTQMFWLDMDADATLATEIMSECLDVFCIDDDDESMAPIIKLDSIARLSNSTSPLEFHVCTTVVSDTECF